MCFFFPETIIGIRKKNCKQKSNHLKNHHPKLEWGDNSSGGISWGDNSSGGKLWGDNSSGGNYEEKTMKQNGTR